MAPRTRLAACLGALALAAACGPGQAGVVENPAGSIAEEYDLSGAELTVGSKNFTEQLILGYIAMGALEAAGATVIDQTGLAGTSAARDSLEAGEIDLYWEYTGTGWISILGEDQPLDTAEEQYQAVAERDAEENDIVWLEPGAFNNTYTLGVHSPSAEEHGVETISDLGGLLEESPEVVTLCVNPEFRFRSDGLPGMQDAYGFQVPEDNIALMDPGLIYVQTVAEGVCTFGEMFETDGRIEALDISLLEDDEEFFASYNPAVTVRAEVLDEHPDIEELLNEITGALPDSQGMRQLNARVDLEGNFEGDVARTWLRENGFIEEG